MIFQQESQDYEAQYKMKENFFQNFSRGEIAEFFEMVENNNNELSTPKVRHLKNIREN